MDSMTFKRTLIAMTLGMSLLFVAVSCDDGDDEQATIPWEPTDGMLNDGPGADAEFLHWSQTGLDIVGELGTSVSAWCYHGDTTHIEMEDMVGLYTYPTSFTEDSLYCTIDIADNDYAQLEYSPDGREWDTPVQLWLDTLVVTLPNGWTADQIVFYHYNRETGNFDEMETTVEENWWIVYTDHFSRYVLGRKVNLN